MTRDQATEYWRLRDAIRRIDVAMRAVDATTIANVARRVEVIADDTERPATAWAPGMRVRDPSDGDTGTVTGLDLPGSIFIRWESFPGDALPMRWDSSGDGLFSDIEVIR